MEICPKDVTKQMMMRVVHDPNKTEQARGGQKEMYVPTEVDHVSGSEPEEEDWEDVDDVRRKSTCDTCGMMGDFARDCRRKGKGRGKGNDGSKGYAKGKGTTMKGAGKKGKGTCGGRKGGPSGESDAGDTENSVGHAVQLDTSRESVDGELLASRGKMTAEAVEDNPSQKGMEKSEESGSLGTDPSTGHRKILTVRKEKAPADVKFVKDDATASVRVREDRDGGFVQESEPPTNVWRRQIGGRMCIAATGLTF